jgi:putative transposase
MPNYIRAKAGGATFFFTLTLQDRSSRMLIDHVVELRECVKQAQARHPFHIDAMVVLPEHLHALWTLPPADADFSTRWMLVKQAFTRRVGDTSRPRATKGERNLWQKRFWEHQIRDDDDFARHVEYIHFNPVKHGWVLRAGDWPYSSLHRFVREGKVCADWGISAAIQGQFGE